MGQAVFKIKWKWREVVLAMYREYGEKPFYNKGCKNIFDLYGGDLHMRGMFAYLRLNGVIRTESGSKRSHITTDKQPSMWCFTDAFIKYMRDGGGERFYVEYGGGECKVEG